MPSEVSTVSGEQSVEELRRELAEAREQQAATSEILRVISSAPSDPERVFAEIAASAARLCQAYDAVIRQVDGDALLLVAHHGPLPVAGTLPLMRGHLVSRAVLEGRTIHVADLQAEINEYPEGSDIARRLGFRTNLSVPLIRASVAIGVINIRRTEVRPFTDRQIELLKTFADQAVIAIENTRLFEAEQASKRELTEALEQQTATSQVLEVISSSPGELEPVFQTMLANATRLCEASFGVLFRYDGNVFHAAAMQAVAPAFAEHLRRNPPRPDQRNALNRLLQTKQPVYITDVTAEPAYAEGEPSRVALVEMAGARTYFVVPMHKDDELIGAIAIYRREVQPFTDKQVQLVASFASQAVIAIENVRLLNELRESLQQQTATADVLKVISRSALDLQKVLDALVESAARLCNAYDAAMFQVVGDGLRLVAHHGQIPLAGPIGQLTRPLVRGLIGGRAVIDRRTIHVADILAEADEYPDSWKNALRFGYHSALAVPLVHAGEAIGVIFVRRAELCPFTERQIELVNTFADQAVIAIENTRLFEEVQTRTRELQEALEQQTATTDVLQVISSSPGELQPVFDGILVNATRVCGANFGNLFLCEGEVLRHVATFGAPPEFAELRRGNPVVRPTPNSIFDRLTTTKQPQHILDFREEQSYLDRAPPSVQLAEIAGARTLLGVPMIKADKVIGTIGIYRRHVEPFTNKQIELVANFAKQAVIAIENTRLLNELRESLQQQTATADVLKVISRSAFNLQAVLDTLIGSAAKLCDADSVGIVQPYGSHYHFAASLGYSPAFAEHMSTVKFTGGRGSMVGRVLSDGQAVHVPDVLTDREYTFAETQRIGGFRTMLGVPLLREGIPAGVLLLTRNAPPRPFTGKQIELANTFADQAVIAIENTRLFEQVQARTRELAKTVEDLEIASQHKSQFVANMSHELRTPLAAILGYAELMQEGFYESQGPKSLDALTRIRSNGKHLLGLINTVLDIAKIESGQFTLNMTEYAIESVVETVRSATESLAQNKKLVLKTEVAKSLPIGLGDEQRLTQVLLNLVGNAIKFTDTGEVRVTAKAVNGHFNVSVSDTGPGIPEEHKTRIFDQFHQVDSSNTKAKGGTGLGLAIAKQIVEMHGGRIWVESTLGKGSTFQMELPTRAEFRKNAP